MAVVLCCGRSAAQRIGAPKGVCAPTSAGTPPAHPQYPPRRKLLEHYAGALVSSRLELELATSYGYLKEVSANLR